MKPTSLPQLFVPVCLGLLTIFGTACRAQSAPADPWRVLEMVPGAFRGAVACQTPYHWAGAYGLVVLLLVGLSLFRTSEEEVAVASEGITLDGKNRV